MTQQEALISQDQARSIILKLSSIFDLPRSPNVQFWPDHVLQSMHYYAFCVPLENYIVFRQVRVTKDTSFHEFGHIYDYYLTGKSDQDATQQSEGVAQWFGSMALLDEELLGFVCSNCQSVPTKLLLLPDGSFNCKWCGKNYFIQLY